MVSSVIAACVFFLLAATSTHAAETDKKKPPATAAELTKKKPDANAADTAKKDPKATIADAAKKDSQTKAVESKKDPKAKTAEAKKDPKAKSAGAAKSGPRVKSAEAKKKALAKAVQAFKKMKSETKPALVGIASVYRYKKPRRGASGEIINFTSLIAAHRTLRFGTRVRVTNRKNGKSVVVRIIDRGPFIRGRVIDLSPAAARQIGLGWGLAPVTLAVVNGVKA
jgi:rare lipoprotein A